MKSYLLKYKSYCEQNPFARYMSMSRFSNIYDKILDNIEKQLEICCDFRKDIPYMIEFFNNKNAKKDFIINYVKPKYQCANIWKISTEYIEDPVLTLLAVKNTNKARDMWNSTIPRLIIDNDDYYQSNNFITIINFCKTFNFNNQETNSNIIDIILKCIINSSEQNNFIQKCLQFINIKYEQNNKSIDWLKNYLNYLESNNFKKKFKEKLENNNIILQERQELFYELGFSVLNTIINMNSKIEEILSLKL